MKVYYDLHIHSCLSPCADDEMTPLNIVMMAEARGLQAIAITDHNAIDNVESAIECGEAVGITVIPGIEVQTSEDIHIVALFPSFINLKNFFSELTFPFIKNREDIFGSQFIVNSDGERVGIKENLLKVSAFQGIYEIGALTEKHKGAFIAAHIDREANGIISILGEMPEDLNFSAIELSEKERQGKAEKSSQTECSGKERQEKTEKSNQTRASEIDFTPVKVLYSSDAHCLMNISKKENFLEAESFSAEAIIKYLKS